MRFVPFLIALVSIAAHAADESSSQQVPAPSNSSTAVSSAAGSTGVPDLQIDWDCGDCKPNEKVPPLIQAGYAHAASKGHVDVGDGDKVVVKITDFRQRNPALRSLFGVMAGIDKLTVSISWHGKQATAHETSANALQGMNSLSESVGKQTFAAVQKLVAAERSDSGKTAQ